MHAYMKMKRGGSWGLPLCVHVCIITFQLAYIRVNPIGIRANSIW